MITVGIDVGFEKIKIVILKDKEILIQDETKSGGGARVEAVDRLWKSALKAVSLEESDIDHVSATGQGKHDVGFADLRITQPVADAKAARFLYPEATSVVDFGADQICITAIGEGDSISEVVINQKCSAGLGTFFRYMARRFGMTVEEISRLTPSVDNNLITLNEGCAVFMELSALDHLFSGVKKEDVMRAIIDAMAVRVNSVLKDKIKLDKQSTVLVGGVSLNTALMNALRKRSGIDFNIPIKSEYCGALGAALMTGI